MKKLLFIPLFLLSILASVQAQPFTIISWISVFLEDNPDARYYDIDFSTDSYEKKSMIATPLPSTVIMDVSGMDENDFNSLWNQIGDEEFVDNQIHSTPANDGKYDIGSDGGTFGASFKVCFDDEFLYVLMKYFDVNNICLDNSRTFEIMMQTKTPDRYEDGFQAAQSKFGLTGTNAQYGRFIELGGSNIILGKDGIFTSMSTSGQLGSWSNALNANNGFDYFWYEDEEGTINAVLALSFADDMFYMDDVWGPYDADNYVAFDPEEINTISFDLRVNGKEDEETYITYCWSSNANEGYALNYFAGYLNFFSDPYPKPVVESPVYYCTGEPVTALTAEGSDLKWYTGPSGGEALNEAFIPSAAVAGTTKYYVSQVVNGLESARAEIKVIVSDLEVEISGDTIIECNSEAVFEASDNYMGGSVISYEWEFNSEISTGENFTTTPITEEKTLALSASTESGCSASASVLLSLVPKTPPSLVLASYDNESGKNRIQWKNTQEGGIDSILIFRGKNTESPELIETIKYSPEIDTYVDLTSEPDDYTYSYLLKISDGCGFISEESETLSTMQLEAVQIIYDKLQLFWDKYGGRQVEKYIVYMGLSPESLTVIGEVSPANNKWIEALPLNPVYYQLEAQLVANSSDPSSRKSRSNILLFDNPVMVVYDTILIENCISWGDTLRFDAGLSIGMKPGENYISVYPNPTQGKVTIELDVKNDYSDYVLRIVSITGQVIFSNVCNQSLFEIDINEFGLKGLYYLQFMNPYEAVLETRVIVLQ